MASPTFTSLVSRGLRAIDRLFAPSRAEAHCDIPCGIYDPHLMQVGALTVIRMNQLIDGLAKEADEGKRTNNLSRYILVKEEHAELVKREARIIYGDYFKPEHVEKHANLHTLTWNILKLGGKNKQEINMQAAQELLTACQQFAEIFWDTKGVATKKQPSNQAVGGEIVVPSN